MSSVWKTVKKNVSTTLVVGRSTSSIILPMENKDAVPYGLDIQNMISSTIQPFHIMTLPPGDAQVKVGLVQRVVFTITDLRSSEFSLCSLF